MSSPCYILHTTCKSIFQPQFLIRPASENRISILRSSYAPSNRVAPTAPLLRTECRCCNGARPLLRRCCTEKKALKARWRSRRSSSGQGRRRGERCRSRPWLCSRWWGGDKSRMGRLASWGRLPAEIEKSFIKRFVYKSENDLRMFVVILTWNISIIIACSKKGLLRFKK